MFSNNCRNSCKLISWLIFIINKQTDSWINAMRQWSKAASSTVCHCEPFFNSTQYSLVFRFISQLKLSLNSQYAHSSTCCFISPVSEKVTTHAHYHIWSHNWMSQTTGVGVGQNSCTIVKNQLISVFDASISPVIEKEFHHNLVKVVFRSTQLLPWHSYFDNIMTKFMFNNRTDAWKTDVNLLFTIIMAYCQRHPDMKEKLFSQPAHG